MQELTSETFEKFRKSRKTLIKNSEIKNSKIKDNKDEKNTIKIVEEFKKNMSKINFEFTLNLLKKMLVKENKRLKNLKV